VAEKAKAASMPARAHVKLDTGMGRLGTFDPAEALALVDFVARENDVTLAGFMTHFATADEPGSAFFEEQLDRFLQVAEAVKRDHPSCILHAANSAAVYRDPRSHLDMARCGIAIYGLDPFHEDPSERNLTPALRLESYVADVKTFAPGQSAGYGRSWKAERETRVGVLPIGYGDGYRRGLSNRSSVIIRGKRFPVAGTISMDNTTVDLGGDSAVRPGDTATLIGTGNGERILAEELAGELGTINYEITCGLLPRVRRLYVRGGESAT
jgi:alanine racemase